MNSGRASRKRGASNLSSVAPVVVAAVMALCLVGAQGAFGAEAREFRAGASTSNITPWYGLDIAGSMSHNAVQDVHDELHVRSLVLDDGESRLVFALVDSCMVPREVFDSAKERIEAAIGIPPENMLMAATHSHSAACATPVFQNDPDPEYNRFLVSRIVDGVRRAHKDLAPARIGWASGSLPEEVHNRRWWMKEDAIPPNPFGEQDKVKMNPPRAHETLIEPAGPIDPEICFLAVEHEDGRPLALLANYSLHYVGNTGGAVSADYFGAFAERIKELLGGDGQDPPFVGILSNGTSGDINNINFTEPTPPRKPYEQIQIVANKVAAEVMKAYQDIVFEDWVPLDSAQTEISLGVRLPAQEEVQRAREIVAQAEGPKQMRGLEQIYARETVHLSEYPEEVPLILQAVRVGDLAITAIPCEVFVEIGLAIKEKSPFDSTFTIELANGYNGYLPTARQHELGGYETWRARSSYLEVDAAAEIQDTVLDLIDEVHGAEQTARASD